MKMRLFAWQPKGHGEQSIFVIAESLESATKAAEAEIERLKNQDDFYCSFNGWGTDYYRLTVAEPGQVITNDND